MNLEGWRCRSEGMRRRGREGRGWGGGGEGKIVVVDF